MWCAPLDWQCAVAIALVSSNTVLCTVLVYKMGHLTKLKKFKNIYNVYDSLMNLISSCPIRSQPTVCLANSSIIDRSIILAH